MTFFFRLFGLDRDPDYLLRERLAVLSRQVPLMYALVSFSIFMLALMHYGMAPDFLTRYFPIAFGAIAILRSVRMMRAPYRQMSRAKVQQELATVVMLALVMGVIVASWAGAMFGYGDASTKGQVTFFVSITVIAVISCLMPLAVVPVGMFFTVILPTAVFLWVQPEPVFRAISLNMATVAIVMVLIFNRIHADFQSRIVQRAKLVRLNHEMSKIANEDSLTGLPNRRRFFAELDARLVAAKKAGTVFAVGIVDLDGFKPINDLFGHPAGDRMLIEAGRRLKEHLPEGAFVARLGGDEFALILPCRPDQKPGEMDYAVSVSRSLLNHLAKPFAVGAAGARVTGTIGLAHYPEAAEEASTLFERADYALYHAKANRRGQVQVYSREHEALAREVASVSQSLRDANLEDELALVYQPIFAARTGELRGFEALARWHNPVLGSVSPEVFIRTAEQDGSIVGLTKVLLQKGLWAARNWPDRLVLSFNLSTFDLCSTTAVDEILLMIAKSGIATDRLVFEVTETAVMQDFDRAILSLIKLKQAGITLALDDFGTGYSHLSYLRKLPIDKVKIDRSFIADLESEGGAEEVLRTIVQLCHNLGLTCVAEGVETDRQLQLIREAGCEETQGYLLARPFEAERLPDYIQRDGYRAG